MRKVGWPLLGLAGVLLVWEVGVLLLKPSPVILPSVSAVASAFFHNVKLLLHETAITMLEAVLGLVVAAVSAYGAAVLFVVMPATRAALYPYAVALKATPLVALAPVLVLWCGNGFLAKVVMSALVAFFPILVGSVAGLTLVDRDADDLFRSLGATRMQILMKLRIPNSLGHLLSSLKVASSLAVVGAVIGEFTGSSYGIGRVITGASYYLETALMFAAIATLGTASVCLFGFITLVEHKAVHWVHVNQGM